MKKVLHSTLRILRNILLGLSLLVLFGLWALKSEYVQGKLLPTVERLLTKELGVPVHVGGVELDIPARVVIKDAMMEDKQGQKLFAAHEVQVSLLSFSLWKLILYPKETKKIRVSHLQLIQPECHLYKSRRDSSLNLDFLSASEDTTPGKPLNLDLDLPEIKLRGGMFSYIDSTASDEELSARGRVNFKNMQFRRISGDFAYHLHPDETMDADISKLSVVEDQVPFFLNEFSSEARLITDKTDPGWLLLCLDHTLLRAGRTHLDFSGQLANQRPDTVDSGFYPVFSADFASSVFDFSTLNYLLPKALPMRDPAMLEGFLWGDQDNIMSDSLAVGIYDDTRLRMAMELNGYTNEEDLKFDLDITRGQLSFEDLQQFLPGTDIPLAGIAQVKGRVKGDLDKLRTRDMELKYGQQTELFLKAQIFDYTKGDDIVMDMSFKDSHLSFKEVGELLPDMQLPPWIDRFGKTDIEGRFIGGPSDFVVDASMGSKYGDVVANLHLILPPSSPDIKYSGWVTTKQLNLKAMEADLPVTSRNFNFTGKVSGHGTEFGKMDADVQGLLTNSYLDGYFLESLETDSLRIRGHKILGGINLRDTHGDASLKLDVLLADTMKRINVVGTVDHVDLAHYDLLPDDSISFSGNFDVHMGGDSLENYIGTVDSKSLQLIRKGSGKTNRKADEFKSDTLEINHFALSSRLSERHEHYLTVNSSLLDMQMRGTFTYKKAYKMLGRISKEISMYIQNNDTVLAKYYAEKMLEPEDVFIWDTIQTRDTLNDVLAFFGVPMYLDPGTMMYMYLEHGITDNLDISISSDSIGYEDIGLKENTVALNIFKDGSQNDLLLIGEVLVDDLRIGEKLNFRNVIFRPEGGDSLMNFELRTIQPDLGNEYVLVARTRFMKDGKIGTQIRPQESVLRIRGQEWRFAKGNFISREFGRPPSLNEGEYPDSVIARYHVRNLNLTQAGQIISIDGDVSKDFLDELTVVIDKLRIKSLLEILEEPMDIDGTVLNSEITAQNLLSTQPTVAWNLFVKDFRYHYGDSVDVFFSGGWPTDKNGEIAQMELRAGHRGTDSLVVTGDYNVVADSLNLLAEESSILLHWVSPLVEGILSDMEGKVTVDRFTVKGPLKNPQLNGVVHLAGAGFKVDYLNNVFRLSDDNINFNNDGVDISGITVSDTFGGSALLNGRIVQSGGEFNARLKLDPINNLTVMDSRKGQNPDFYGRVVLEDGTASVTGPMNSLLLSANVSTGKGTWLDIPLTDYASASRLDFVNFIREGDTLNKDTTVDMGGIALSLTVNARPNARVRMIFDEKVGDIIEARGEGSITLDIDKDGDFKMSGPFTVTEGNYLFTAENIVNKKFLVEEGGTITWSGDPYDAQVSINAIYKVNADISALDPNATARIPVKIVMKMRGSLMQPKIELELDLDGVSGQNILGLSSYIRSIQYDQQELNKQVVSLLLFRRFTGHSATGGGGVAGAGVTSSISELISNQVNFWISQAFENANLGVELNTNEFQDVELALKASLFNNKVTVERNGAIVSNNGSGFSIGDLSVQIKILPASDSGRADPQAGQLVMEIFNREDAALNNANNVSRGLGLFYKKDFDRLSDLLKKRETEKMVDFDEEEEQENPPPSPPQEAPPGAPPEIEPVRQPEDSLREE